MHLGVNIYLFKKFLIVRRIYTHQYFVSKINDADEPVEKLFESFDYPVSYSVLYLSYLVALMYDHLHLRRTWILQGLGLSKQLIEHGQNIFSCTYNNTNKTILIIIIY